MKALTSEVVKKLRIDAENILTWPPTDSDPLTLAHLRRFARAVLDLIDERSTCSECNGQSENCAACDGDESEID
jgi:hypothetical protein